MGLDIRELLAEVGLAGRRVCAAASFAQERLAVVCCEPVVERGHDIDVVRHAIRVGARVVRVEILVHCMDHLRQLRDLRICMCDTNHRRSACCCHQRDP